jgi:hypothetical protein
MVSGDSDDGVHGTHSCAIRSIAQQAQHEEEQGQAFAGPLTLVLDDLRNARPKVADCAQVSQNLRTESNLLRVGVGRLWYPDTGLPGNCPTRSADCTHAKDAECILDPLARGFWDIGDGG